MNDIQTKTNINKLAETIYETYYNYVYTIVFNKLRSCASTEDIEDCIAEIFTEIIVSCNKDGIHSDNLKGFVAKVAKCRAINTYKKISNRKKHISELSDLENTEDKTADVAENYEKSQIQNVILDEIDKLGEPDSIIVLHKYYYKRSAKEIAEIVALKPSAVRQRCSRAMKLLKSRLNHLGIC